MTVIETVLSGLFGTLSAGVFATYLRQSKIIAALQAEFATLQKTVILLAADIKIHHERTDIHRDPIRDKEWCDMVLRGQANLHTYMEQLSASNAAEHKNITEKLVTVTMMQRNLSLMKSFSVEPNEKP